MAQIIKDAGHVLLGAGILLILVGYGCVYIQEGTAGLQAILSPFNVRNYVAVAVTLGPGVALIWTGRIMEQRQKR